MALAQLTQRQQYVRGPNGILLPLRRDCPEILFEPAGSFTTLVSGVSDAYGAWSTLAQATTFRDGHDTSGITKPLLVAGIAMTHQVGAALTAAQVVLNPSTGFARMGRWEVAHGDTDPGTIIAEGNLSGAVTYTVSGNTDGTTTVDISGLYDLLVPLKVWKLLQPTRIAARAAHNDAAAVNIAMAPVGYDPDRLNWHAPLIPDDILMGYSSGQDEQTAYATVTTPTGAWVNSVWADFTVNGQVELDADYYVSGMLLGANATAFPRSLVADVAALPMGETGTEELHVQSRGALLRSGVSRQACHWVFPGGPFVAYKGEKLRFRVRRAVSGAVAHTCTLNLARINPLGG